VTCTYCGATSMVVGSIVKQQAPPDPRGARALARLFHEMHGVDLSRDSTAMDRLGTAWTKAMTELQAVPRTRINLPFITATDKGPLHFDREIDLRDVQRLIGH
jgi:molecular chaperone DnaK